MFYPVERQSSKRETPQSSPNVTFETTFFVAKAQIQKVFNTEHGLSPGSVIEIRYKVVVRQPPDPAFPHYLTLKAGETITLP